MASSSSSSPPGKASETRNWVELPRDVTAMILHKLGAIDILESAQKVCMTWRSICKEPTMWRSIDMRNLGDLWDMGYDLEKMARHAVDRSCGLLSDINIEYFGTDELLQYIAERASQLKRLRLVCCHSISDEGLGEAAKKLLLLEELHIFFGSLSKEALQNVGHCCPQLKSLIFNNKGYKCSHVDCDEEALAIAKTMPGLRDLQLFGNRMTKDGLQAILDGCPLLESLDLRQCFYVYLGGTLGKRCSERIKDLRRPYDSTDDYGFDATVDYGYGYDPFDDDDDEIDINECYEYSGGSDFSEDGELYFYIG